MQTAAGVQSAAARSAPPTGVMRNEFCVGAGLAVAPPRGGAGRPRPAAPLTRVLVFSKTAGFRHSSIPNGIAAIQQLGAANGFTGRPRPRTPTSSPPPTSPSTRRWSGSPPPATCSTPPSRPRSSPTSPPAAATSASTPRPTPSTTGPGTAASSAPTSPPTRPTRRRRVRVEDRGNASTAHLPPTWSRTDEWYNYRTNPRANVKVLASLDESSYTGGTMGGDHPITWCQNYGGGRSWYTGLGHTEAVLHRRQLHPDAARRHPDRRRQPAGRLPPGDRLHRPLRRHPGQPQPVAPGRARAASRWPTAR